MNRQPGRRRFLGECVKCGGAGCALLVLSRISPGLEGAAARQAQGSPAVDLKKLAYCGIPQAYCEQQCELYKATRENDVELKKLVYDKWGMEKKFGIAFEPDKIFCYTCKPGDRPLKVGMAECPVRRCPMANGLESCVQCRNLASCDKAFWKDWPAAFELARKLQARYKDQPGATMKDIVER